MSNTRKYGAIAAALLLVAAVFLLLPMVGVNIVGGSQPAAASTSCDTHFYAYDAPQGSNQFGPAVAKHTVKAGRSRFETKNRCDPLFAATMVAFVKNGENLSTSEVRDTASRFSHDSQSWKDAMKVLDQQITGYSVKYESHTYETVSMIPGSNDKVMPQLAKLDRPVVAGYVLVLHLQNGQTRELRFVCDLQPVAPHFPHLTPHHPQPGCKVANCTPNGGCKVANCHPNHGCQPGNCPPHNVCTLKPKPGYVVTAKCTYYKPPQTKNCQQNGTWTKGCPPNQADQPVQDNPCCYTGPTKGSGSEPSPNPTGPTPQSGSPAPPPNSGGYDSGSSNGSGTPGGTTCNNGTCSGGGSTSGSGPTDNTNSGDNNGTDGSGNSTGNGDVPNPFG